MKVCFKCGEEKVLDDFYKHPKMPGGHVNKCKECNKKDVALNYRENILHFVEYERLRFKRPERKEQLKAYQRKRRSEDPVKNTTRHTTSNAIRDRRLIKGVCMICGCEKVEAHHKDYTKPFDVEWLCRKHHLEQHNKSYHVGVTF